MILLRLTKEQEQQVRACVGEATPLLLESLDKPKHGIVLAAIIGLGMHGTELVMDLTLKPDCWPRRVGNEAAKEPT
jgi:hypothetical protein